ncbi:retrovirus-related pol polyprotein from transposon TNT 1-94 [Tanacetum coccineum]
METEVESMVTVPIQQVSSSVPLLILQSSISHLLNQYLLPVKNHSLQLSPPTSALQQSSSVLEMVKSRLLCKSFRTCAPSLMDYWIHQFQDHAILRPVPQLMAPDHSSSGPVLHEMMSDHNSSVLAPQRQEMSVENVSSGLQERQIRHNNYRLEFLSVLYLKNITIQHSCQLRKQQYQAPMHRLQEDEFINPFCTRVQEIVQYNVDRLPPDPEMCMFALTVSIVEPKNIKEAMADSAWIEAMQDELHQFDRLNTSRELVEQKNHLAKWKRFTLLSRKGSLIRSSESLPSKESFVWIKASSKSLIYVDDIIFGSTNPKYSKRFEKLMHSRFEMSLMGEMKFFLGLQIHQSPKVRPIDHQSDYRSKIGSLMYLTSSRPDLVQAVCYCARYQARPTQKHLKEVKRIFKYLKGTINMGLWYPKDSGFELTAFSDADHAGCLDTRKSTFEDTNSLGDKIVKLDAKKQTALQCL